jgi:lysophospholipase L1-like esterase
MSLSEVHEGDPHVQAHNEERSLINGIQELTNPDFVDRLLATYATVRKNTWASIGDSISARSATLNGSGGLNSDRRSWQEWTNTILGRRFEPVTYYAVSGKRADEMVTEQLPQVIAQSPRPGYCTVLAGTNDVFANRTEAQIRADLTSIIEGLITAGIRPIVGTILPRTGLTGAQNTVLVKVNDWLRRYCPTVGAILIDWYGALSDSVGAPKANALYDGTHPSIVGAVYMARVAAAALSPHIPAVNRLPMSNLESPSPNLLTNPVMTGTSGTKWDAGITGNVASNWIARFPSGAGTAVASKVARTDNVPGEWQQIAQSAGTGVQVYQSVTDTSRFAAGDQLYALVELECDSDLSGATDLQVFIQATNPAGQTSEALHKGADPYVGAIAVPTSGVYRTPAITVASGLTDLRLFVKISGGTPTFRVGRCAILKAN